MKLHENTGLANGWMQFLYSVSEKCAYHLSWNKLTIVDSHKSNTMLSFSYSQDVPLLKKQIHSQKPGIDSASIKIYNLNVFSMYANKPWNINLSFPTSSTSFSSEPSFSHSLRLSDLAVTSSSWMELNSPSIWRAFSSQVSVCTFDLRTCSSRLKFSFSY